jgi:hypothetical protein
MANIEKGEGQASSVVMTYRCCHRGWSMARIATRLEGLDDMHAPAIAWGNVVNIGLARFAYRHVAELAAAKCTDGRLSLIGVLMS